MDRPMRDIIEEGKLDTSSHNQKQDFLSLFHQPEMEFNLKNQLIKDLNETEPTPKGKLLIDDMFEKFWKKRKIEEVVQSQKKHFVIRFTQWAAILAIGLILGYYYNSLQKASTPVYYTSVAPNGSVSEMILPDGSHIFLNSGSEIKYTVDGTDGMREIFLKGEAWFQVTKMERKPFVVHTPFYDVHVTGTSFNVKAYPEDEEVTTTLEEGKVFVKSSEKLILAADAEMNPGEQLVYNKESKRISIAEVNTRQFTSWKNNKLVFVNMSLKELKTLLERKYGVDIEFSDQSIPDYHYDGTLKNETILEVLKILENTLPIQYQIVGQKIIIQKK